MAFQALLNEKYHNSAEKTDRKILHPSPPESWNSWTITAEISSCREFNFL